MNMTFSHSPRFLWTPQQLADAVPLRLSQLLDFNALHGATPAAANTLHRSRRDSQGYLPSASRSDAFRVR